MVAAPHQLLRHRERRAKRAVVKTLVTAEMAMLALLKTTNLRRLLKWYNAILVTCLKPLFCYLGPVAPSLVHFNPWLTHWPDHESSE